jgi:hypothetical protein
MTRTPQPPDDPPNLSSWLPPEEIEEGPTALMMAYGYSRNIVRHAEAWGPHLIAELVKAGVLEAEGDPLEALQALIAKARCAVCRRVECTCEDSDVTLPVKRERSFPRFGDRVRQARITVNRNPQDKKEGP